MSISGLPPSGGANRIANSYGFAPKRAPAAVEGQGSRAEKSPSTLDSRPSTSVPSLRSVLNDEERAYFDQLTAMGPITYGPGAKAGMVPDAPRGLRLDVRG